MASSRSRIGRGGGRAGGGRGDRRSRALAAWRTKHVRTVGARRRGALRYLNQMKAPPPALAPYAPGGEFYDVRPQTPPMEEDFYSKFILQEEEEEEEERRRNLRFDGEGSSSGGAGGRDDLVFARNDEEEEAAIAQAKAESEAEAKAEAERNVALVAAYIAKEEQAPAATIVFLD